MFIGYSIVTLRDNSEQIRITISTMGGLFTITYNDFKPIPGAKVEVFSQKGTKWAEISLVLMEELNAFGCNLRLVLMNTRQRYLLAKKYPMITQNFALHPDITTNL